MSAGITQHVVEFGKGGTSPAESDGRLDAPAFHRNHAPIGSVLSRILSDGTGDVLEIGSGTGQHVVEYARHAPAITWWPTDLLDSHLRSIDAWRRHEARDNVRVPVRLDASAPDWTLAAHGLPSSFTAIVCVNVIHIAPWRVTEGIVAGARRHLRPGGRLVLYGAFRRDGVHSSPGNEAFDANLRRDNSEWGVRDTADLRTLGAATGLPFAELVEMPSNNAILMFEQRA
jgi:SAM-dependent methyltransferase